MYNKKVSLFLLILVMVMPFSLAWDVSDLEELFGNLIYGSNDGNEIIPIKTDTDGRLEIVQYTTTNLNLSNFGNSSFINFSSLGGLIIANLSLCDNNEIMKMDTSGWVCEADATGTQDIVSIWNWANNDSLVLDNDTIIRTGNDTWAIETVNDSISSYYNHSIDLTNYIADASNYQSIDAVFNWADNLSALLDNITINRSIDLSLYNQSVNLDLYNQSIDLEDYNWSLDLSNYYTKTEADSSDSTTDTDLLDIWNVTMHETALPDYWELENFTSAFNNAIGDTDNLDIVNQTMLGLALNSLDNISLSELFTFFEDNITSANNSIINYIDSVDTTTDTDLLDIWNVTMHESALPDYWELENLTNYLTNNDITIGGGFGSTGITLETDGDIWMDGSLYILGNISNVGIDNLNINGSLLPTIDNTFDVGNGSYQWRNGNFSGTLQANQFSGDGSLLTGINIGDTSETDEFTMLNYSNEYSSSGFDNENFTERIGLADVSNFKLENVTNDTIGVDEFDNNTINRSIENLHDYITDTDLLDLVNVSMLDNETINRSVNLDLYNQSIDLDGYTLNSELNNDTINRSIENLHNYITDTDELDIINTTLFNIGLITLNETIVEFLDNDTVNRSIDLADYNWSLDLSNYYTIAEADSADDDTIFDPDTMDIVNTSMLGVALDSLDNISYTETFTFFEDNITSANDSMKIYIDALPTGGDTDELGIFNVTMNENQLPALWEIENASAYLTAEGYNKSINHITINEDQILDLSHYATANFITDYENQAYYKKANLTLDYPNLDTDSTNDYATADFTTDLTPYLTHFWELENFTSAFGTKIDLYIPHFYELENFTTHYEAEIPTCGGGEFTTGDGSDLSCSTPTDTTTDTDLLGILNVTNFNIYLPDFWEIENFTASFEAEVPSCGVGQVLKGDGSDLSCVTDSATDTDLLAIVNVTMLNNDTIARMNTTNVGNFTISEGFKQCFNANCSSYLCRNGSNGIFMMVNEKPDEVCE